MEAIHKIKKIIRRFAWIFGLDIIKRRDNPLWLKKLKIKTIMRGYLLYQKTKYR